MREAITRNLESLGDFLGALLPEMLMQRFSNHYLTASSQSKHDWPLPVSSVSPTSEALYLLVKKSSAIVYDCFQCFSAFPRFEFGGRANNLN